MKKLTVLALLCAFTLGACVPNLLTRNNPTAPAPQIDAAGTVNAIVQTANAQTLTAQPSPTPVLATETFTTTPTGPSPTLVPISTDTPIPNLTTTPATATSGPADLTPTATPTAVLSGQPTASPTNGILTYGTLPPQNHPYTQVTLVNLSRREVYISLQIVTDQGYTIIEYPVKHTVKVSIPVGDYTYVVWVGGRQIIGFFHAGNGSEPTIKIYKDRVEIN